jgi:5'-phosphate synthase pdxT subunit
VDVKIGVLALQGDVSEHCAAFLHLGQDVDVKEIRGGTDPEAFDAIVIPGGESTTIGRLIDKNHMRRPLEEFEGSFFATCAGMVLLATEVDDPRVEPLGIIDMSVERNAFGRQKDSFEADIPILGLPSPFHAIFIRAPVVRSVGPGVEVLGRIEQGIVAVRQGPHMALSFHPELGGDLRLHRMFLGNI